MYIAYNMYNTLFRLNVLINILLILSIIHDGVIILELFIA